MKKQLFDVTIIGDQPRVINQDFLFVVKIMTRTTSITIVATKRISIREDWKTIFFGTTIDDLPTFNRVMVPTIKVKVRVPNSPIGLKMVVRKVPSFEEIKGNTNCGKIHEVKTEIVITKKQD